MSTPIEILLIEDNPADIRLAQETLKEYKIQNNISVVRDGELAIEYLSRTGQFANAPIPDMILLDLNLPKKDGLEVLAMMQTDELLRSIPIVILTSSPADERILKQYDIPTDCYVQKPLTLERYLEAVRCFKNLGLAIVKTAVV